MIGSCIILTRFSPVTRVAFRLNLLKCASRQRLLPFTQYLHHTTNTMAPSKDEKAQATSNGHSSKEIEGEENEWKFRAPYVGLSF